MCGVVFCQQVTSDGRNSWSDSLRVSAECCSALSCYANSNAAMAWNMPFSRFHNLSLTLQLVWIFIIYICILFCCYCWLHLSILSISAFTVQHFEGFPNVNFYLHFKLQLKCRNIKSNGKIAFISKKPYVRRKALHWTRPCYWHWMTFLQQQHAPNTFCFSAVPTSQMFFCMSVLLMCLWQRSCSRSLLWAPWTQCSGKPTKPTVNSLNSVKY